jgi:hypothetical protein
MSFVPRPCAHCANTTFHVLPGIQLEVRYATTVLGLSASRTIPGVWLTVTLVACTQCGRTETFASNVPQVATHVPGATSVTSVGR